MGYEDDALKAEIAASRDQTLQALDLSRENREHGERMAELADGAYAENAALKVEVERLTQLAGDLGDRLEEIEEERMRVLAEECPTDEKHCACVPILRAAIAATK